MCWLADLAVTVDSRQFRRHGIACGSLLATALLFNSFGASAGELGHFAPGVFNIRDFAMPSPGLYGALYNYFYTTNRLNDRNGNKVRSVTIGPGPGVTLDVDVNVDIYVVAPTLIWASPWTIAGARYGALISPTFATSSLGAALAVETGRGVNAETSTFGAGDMYVQPLWLDWALPDWDFALAYGFYAPIGKYGVDTATFPVVGPLKVESSDNIGLGFWTHQFQGAITWYPTEQHATALSVALTYEINQEKQDFDLTPGSRLTLNWGASQYLPLTTDHTLLLEIGPAGYSQWQLTDDTGSDARNPDVHDQVHAVGGQLGLTYVPWNAVMNFHYFYEFAAEDRFQGQSLGLNFAVKF